MLGIHKAITHQHTHTACSHREEIDSHPPQTSTQSPNMTFDFFPPFALSFLFHTKKSCLSNSKRTIKNNPELLAVINKGYNCHDQYFNVKYLFQSSIP